jgi:hypothetical protein
MTRIVRTLHEDQYAFFTISRSVLLRMKNVTGKKVIKKIKTHILCSVTLFFSEKLTFCEIIWKNSVEPGSPQMTIWLMRIAFWTPKATDTHS